MDVKINLSIPVTLFNYRESDNSLYSLAKLKIFYVGETADKRLFTKEFSDNLIKSLPYVPVVGYYNDESEDFEGHKQDIQHIYGMVPEDTGVEYIKEEGKEYAVCDIILYTGRRDKTGEIASKIVGKQHSLELNPDNTTYEINKDHKGRIKNIEFKTGSLLGLSVLGDGENPAFSGSEFFNEDSELMKVFMGFKEEIGKFTKHIEQRGEDMEKEIFESALSFLKRAYSEKISIMYSKLTAMYGDEFYVPQVFDDYIIVATWNDEVGEVEYSRLPYSENEEGDIVFEDGVIVYPRYLSKEETSIWENNIGTNASNQGVEENMQEDDEEEEEEDFQDNPTVEDSTNASENETESEVFDGHSDDEEEEEEENYQEDDEEDDEDEDNKDYKNATETTTTNTIETEGTVTEEFSSNNDNEDDTEHEEEETQQDAQVEENTFSTALDNSEREELEAFRREKKQKLIDSFEEDLSKKFLSQLNEDVDSHSFDELEVILSKEFTKISRENKSKTSNTNNAFIYGSKTTPSQAKTEQEIALDLVRRYK